ncbi:871ddab0-5d07-4a46-bf51-80598adcc023 [Sclerotinia trifoliorum]|uniref:871ddab0-5d07-4a46-bf51-80598adcc023 n=1 Tax=Sclerotinia trifoliorum TaxID=28548 RepID=A0A8H2VXR7_9HELO|nr:871ddab0-5d07-4a46-bf51-80598adcc023 [Sclerotinia trifoliorum]
MPQQLRTPSTMPKPRTTKRKAADKLGGKVPSKGVGRKRVISNSKRVNPKRREQSKNAADVVNTFLHLPPEVREMIYRHIMVKENPIQITSPMDTLPDKHPEKKTRTPLKGGLALLQVSKAIHHDVAQYFYKHNNFVIGSPVKHVQHAARFIKSCRSSINPNHHGLQSFLTRVPRFYINCIRELTIVTSVAILTRSHYCGIWGYPGIATCLEHSVRHHLPHSIMTHFQKMTVVALKRFPSLRVANLIFTDSEDARDDGPEWDYWSTEKSLANSFGNILHHDNLREINLKLDLKGQAPHFRFCSRHRMDSSHTFYVIEKAMRMAVKDQDGLWTSPETDGDESSLARGILLLEYRGEEGGENIDANRTYLWKISRED